MPGKHCLKSCKTVCNHLSKIDRRSTRVKTKFLRVGCVGGVGKALYYHRFVDVLSMGNGMKWMMSLEICVFAGLGLILP